MPVAGRRCWIYWLLTLLVVGMFTFGGSWVLYRVTNLIVPIRVNAEDKTRGLDTSQHGKTVLAA